MSGRTAHPEAGRTGRPGTRNQGRTIQGRTNQGRTSREAA